MKIAQKTMIATAITATLSLSAGVVGAADALRTMRPMQGVTFDIGTKHSVSYFLSENGQCKLVLTLAGEPDWEGVPSFTVTRFEAAIPAGKTTRYSSEEGKAVEFACQADAQAMSVKSVNEVEVGAIP